MCGGIRFTIVTAILTTACLAQEGFTVRSDGKQQWPMAEAQKLYESACAVVQQEFGTRHKVQPQFTLVLGAPRNEVSADKKEIRLTQWNRYLFVQGVIMLAFEDLMPLEERTVMAKRAVSWADSTIDVKRFTK